MRQYESNGNTLNLCSEDTGFESRCVHRLVFTEIFLIVFGSMPKQYLKQGLRFICFHILSQFIIHYPDTGRCVVQVTKSYKINYK
jgi:hypothetical protein